MQDHAAACTGGSDREPKEADRAKLERMASYAQSAMCRWKLLLDSFGESDGPDTCGECDNCRRFQASTRS